MPGHRMQNEKYWMETKRQRQMDVFGSIQQYQWQPTSLGTTAEWNDEQWKKTETGFYAIQNCVQFKQ